MSNRGPDNLPSSSDVSSTHATTGSGLTVRSRGEGAPPALRWAGGAAVGAVTIAVFLPSLGHDFVNFDDIENFLRNPHFRGLGWTNLAWMFTSIHLGHYIPVTWLTLGLDYAVWGMNPRGYHLSSVLLHGLNAVLVYGLALRLMSLAFAPSRTSGERAPSPPLALILGAIVAALLFSIHPLRVESVAWVTERRDLVSGLFALLTVLAYLRAYRLGEHGRLHRGWLAGASLLFVLSLLSKSIVVGLPIVLLALDVYPLRRISGTEPSPVRQALGLMAEKLPFIVAAAAVGVTMLVAGARREVLTSFDVLGMGERLSISVYGLAFYLWKTALPLRLSPLYELRYPISPLLGSYLGAAALVAALTIAVVAARRKWPAGLVAWVIYIALLSPVIGIAHNGMQIAADRYTYLACLPWALLAGAGLAAGCRARAERGARPRLAKLVLLLAAVLLASLGALSVIQVRVWQNSTSLWRHALALDPKSSVAHFHLGQALWLDGRTGEAQAELERAIALAPERLRNAKAAFHATLGLLHQTQGQLAEAERSYRAAIGYSEDNVLARINLGAILARRGEQAAALDSFRRVLQVKPGDAYACQQARRLAASLGTSPAELDSCSREDRS